MFYLITIRQHKPQNKLRDRSFLKGRGRGGEGEGGVGRRWDLQGARQKIAFEGGLLKK